MEITIVYLSLDAYSTDHASNTDDAVGGAMPSFEFGMILGGMSAIVAFLVIFAVLKARGLRVTFEEEPADAEKERRSDRDEV